VPHAKVREQILSIYGPLSLLVLLGVWAALLISGFGLVYFAMGTPFTDAMMTRFAGTRLALLTDLYVSGTTLFTLGLGDVYPAKPLVRGLIILESGYGLGLVALVIGYLPVLYTAFSRREVAVALLDARAGSPPTAAELLTRHGFDGGDEALVQLLAEWERWAAELLESHVSYPMLCYYRSQHDNQNWLSALVCVLDSCALIISSVQGMPTRQAQLTFAIARHALVDLGHIFGLEGLAKGLQASEPDRLPHASFGRLCEALRETEIQLCGDPAAAERLRKLRALYEPHALALGCYLAIALPLWIAEPDKRDPWRAVNQLRSSPAGTNRRASHVSPRSVAAELEDEHRH
jgi:hypothetical protein